MTPFIVGLAAIGTIAAIWFGYPVVVRALAALRRPVRPDATSEPSVSVVVASRDDGDAIRSRVANLLDGQYPREKLEVIIALDATRVEGADDEFGPTDVVRVVTGDAPGGKSATLNAGVRAARNDVLVFTDTAQQFDAGAIRALVTALREPRVGAASGMLDLAEPPHGGLNLAERYWRYERWLRRWEARLHSCVGVTGAIYAMPRRLWTPLPANLILDDVFVPMRLVLDGWRIAFTPDARARDRRRFAAAQEYRRKVRTLTGVIQVCAWLPAVLNPLRNPIWLQFVFHKLLRLLTPYLAAVACLGIAWGFAWMLLSWWGAQRLLIAVAVGAAVLFVTPRIRRALAGQLAWAVALQTSIVVATVNGLRGKWDVWHAATVPSSSRAE